MYPFTDTNAVPQEQIIPTEAPMINGTYLEELIPGYRTLTVQGREALTAEVETQTVGKRDGSVFSSRRYPERVIKIRYQLICRTAEDFRAAYNTLAAALNLQDAQLIFNDEPDKYFTGTPGQLENVTPGRNAITSEFEIICPDPYKYSVQEYEVAPSQDGAFRINYGGTFPAHPSLAAQFLEEGNTTDAGQSSTITGNGDCGYIAFYDEDQHVLQFGDPEEVDGAEQEATQTLLAASLKSSSAWTSAVTAVWKTNDANAVITTGGAKTGTAGMIKSRTTVTDASTQYFVGATAYGTGTGWHGPVISALIPDDASGGSGADNFLFQFAANCCVGETTEEKKGVGGIACYLSDANGSKTLGVRIYKNRSGTTGYVDFIVDKKVMETVGIDMSLRSVYFGRDRAETKKKVNGKEVVLPAIRTKKTVRITKVGDTVTIDAGGIVRTYETEDLPTITRISIQFQAYGAKPTLAWNGIYSWKFNKMFCATWREDPNKFTANDRLEIDCSDGTVLLNGLPSPGLGALKNDWESFVLTPGDNVISQAYSDWCVSPPTVRLKYREVFL